MNNNFIKLASIICIAALGCSIASAERKLPIKEVKPAHATLPVITVPADQVKEKIEEKVITPAADKSNESVKQGKQTNAPISDVKNKDSELIEYIDPNILNKEEILIKQNSEGAVETEVKPVTAPVANPLAVPVTAPALKPVTVVPIKASELNPESSNTPASSIIKPANKELSLPAKEEIKPAKDESVQKQEGTIFDRFEVKENLKINKTSK